MRIDAHHHFWTYRPEDFPWIGDEMAAIQRDFFVEDLQRCLRLCGITGTVPVQARMKAEETEWLLDLADKHDVIKGVVGWVPLTAPDVEEHLAPFAQNTKLKGIRHILHDEPDDNYMLRRDFNQGIKKLTERNLVYDILIFEKHLPQTIEFVDGHPSQTFVLDHIAKPRIKANEYSPWREHIRTLAERPHVYCKLSGLVTEADLRNWTVEQLRPYMETVLDAFGPERIMFGSDWPVCNAASNYGEWFGIVSDFTKQLSQHEQGRILGGTAIEAYSLEVSENVP